MVYDEQHHQQTKDICLYRNYIYILIYLFIGPLVSLSLKRFSTRQVTMAGALVCALGLISSAFAPSVSVLIVMYGIVAGASRGFFSLIFGFCRMY